MRINKKILSFGLLLFLLLSLVFPVEISTAKTLYVVTPVLYTSTIVTQSKTFVWNYGKDNYTWKIEVPTNLLKADRTKSAYVSKFFNSSGNTQQQMLTASSSLMKTMIQENYRTSPYGEFLAWTKEPSNVYYVKKLALCLNSAAKKRGYMSLETRNRISVAKTGVKRKPKTVAKMAAKHWKGGAPVSRRKSNARRRKLGFVLLNEPLPVHVGHHIDAERIINMPKVLHRSIYHNQHTGQGMGKINAEAYNFLFKQEVEAVINNGSLR